MQPHTSLLIATDQAGSKLVLIHDPQEDYPRWKTCITRSRGARKALKQIEMLLEAEEYDFETFIGFFLMYGLTPKLGEWIGGQWERIYPPMNEIERLLAAMPESRDPWN